LFAYLADPVAAESYTWTACAGSIRTRGWGRAFPPPQDRDDLHYDRMGRRQQDTKVLHDARPTEVADTA
jgi:hypothetical protein